MLALSQLQVVCSLELRLLQCSETVVWFVPFLLDSQHAYSGALLADSLVQTILHPQIPALSSVLDSLGSH